MRIRKDAGTMPREEIELIANASDALAHPVRVEIFRFIYIQNLMRRTVCNKDLVENFDYAQSTISQHTQKLVESGLLTAEKKGVYSYYFVNLGLLGKYMSAIKNLSSGINEKK